MAEVSGQKFHYLDHATAPVSEAPPVQNTWYECFHDYDVRLLWCIFRQANDEPANKDIEVRWTIDGNVYAMSFDAPSGTTHYVNRGHRIGTPLIIGTDIVNAARNVDKRGQDFKVEVRITSPLGTNQTLEMWCVYETLELT